MLSIFADRRLIFLTMLCLIGCRNDRVSEEGDSSDNGGDVSGENEGLWDVSARAAKASDAVYSRKADLNAAFGAIGFPTVKEFTHDSLRAVVCSDHGATFVVFRGTDSAADWIVNGDVRRTAISGGNAHRGFHEAVMHLRDKIVTEAALQGGAEKPVYVTGHSLGGAMAALFAYECLTPQVKLLQIKGLITFGQPLPFDTKTATLMNSHLGKTYWRFVNGSDVVTRLLPKFRHAGTRIHLHGEGAYKRSDATVTTKSLDATIEEDDPEAMSEEEFIELQVELKGEIVVGGGAEERVKGKIPLLADHSMSLYVQKIAVIRENKAAVTSTSESAVSSSMQAITVDGTGATGQDLQHQPGSRTGRIAFLVGINDYASTSISDLRGCVNDTARLQQLLATQYGFLPEDIVMLTNEQATKKRIIQSFREHLIKHAATDRIAVFYFSGHGSRMPDQENGDETDHWDETIVPHDSRLPGKFDISDDELNGLVQELISVTKNATIILDSCHSGTGTRDLAAPRVAPDDERSPPTRAAFAKDDKLQSARGADELMQLQKCALIYGCRANQYSYEYVSPKHGTVGALTHFFLKAAENGRGGLTYRDVMDQVKREVNDEFPNQLPQLEGGHDHRVFGVGENIVAPHVLASAGDRPGTVVLQAGRVHGVTQGSVYSVYSPGVKDFANATPVTSATVQKVDFREATAKLPEESVVKIKPASRAVEIMHNYADRRFPVFVGEQMARNQDSPALSDIRTLFSGTEKVDVEADNSGTFEQQFELVKERGDAKILLLHHEGKVAVYRGSLDEPASSPIDLAAEDCWERLASQLRAWAKWYRVLEIENNGPNVFFKAEPVNRLDGEISGEPSVRHEGKVQFEVTNNGDGDIYFTILNLSGDGQVSVIYPPLGREDRLPKGKTWKINGKLPSTTVRVPKGYDSISDYFKLIVTQTPVSFDFLNQMAPRDPLTNGKRGVRGDAHPLARLIGDYAFVTKQADSISIPANSWSTHVRLVRVVR